MLKLVYAPDELVWFTCDLENSERLAKDCPVYPLSSRSKKQDGQSQSPGFDALSDSRYCIYHHVLTDEVVAEEVEGNHVSVVLDGLGQSIRQHRVFFDGFVGATSPARTAVAGIVGALFLADLDARYLVHLKTECRLDDVKSGLVAVL